MCGVTDSLLRHSPATFSIYSVRRKTKKVILISDEIYPAKKSCVQELCKWLNRQSILKIGNDGM